jgi:hypothetical protein
MLEFQEHVLKQELDRVPPRSRAAFAACCAQRTSAICRRFLVQSGSNDRTSVFDSAIDYAWNHILDTPHAATTDQMLASVMALIPDQDAPGWTPLTAYAEDGLSSLAYCLRCLKSGESQEAVWAAGRPYEALDYFVTVRDNISPDGQASEARILGDPVIQAELARQARDIAELSAIGDSLGRPLLDELRRRSESEQVISSDELDQIMS